MRPLRRLTPARAPSLVALASVLALTGTAAAQDVKYEKYKLENGLTVILHEDHTVPVAAVNLWYRVGSKDEAVRRSGFAHLFEHLMFMGTKRVPNGSFDQIMEAGGGSNNATTSSDRTNYFSNGPASLLPTLLWLDADRLEDLGHAMTQEKLDRQRDVVRNERRQNTENEPYGKSELTIEGLLFPDGHPYHLPVIGSHEDLEAATVQDVKDFFATYYVPNNCSLVVAGDFDPAKLKPLIAALFGSIPRGAEPPHRKASPVKLPGVIRQTVVDKVQLPKIAMAYHSPALFAAGDAEMDLVASILTEGNTSRLYKRLVIDEKLASSVSAYQSSAELASTFRIDVVAQAGASLEAIEKAVDEEVARLLEKGPTAAELSQRQTSVELGALARLQSVEAKADKLNEYEAYFGEPNSFKADLDRYRNATLEGVRDRARSVLTQTARVVLRVLPEDPARAPSARDERPKDEPKKAFAPAGPESFKLSNGIPVLLFARPQLPLVSAELLFKADGPLVDGAGKRAGLASLTTSLMTEGAGELDSMAFGEALQALGAKVGASSGREHGSVSLSVLRRGFEKAAALAADVVRRPRFEAKDFERVKRLHLEGLKQEDDDPNTVASHVSSRVFYGDEHPFAWPSDGTLASVEALDLESVKAQHARLFRPDGCTILIAGDVTPAVARATLEKLFGDWKAAAPRPAAASAAPAPARDKLRVFVVDRPDAVQTVIRFQLPGVARSDARRVPLRALNTLFGGGFTSRLNQNLREAHGYTYGAGSRFAFERTGGTFVVSTSVKADVTGASLKECLAEIEKVRKGDVTEEETAKARESLATDSVQALQGLSGTLGLAAEQVLADEPFEALAADLARLGAVTAKELNGLVQGAIPLEKGVLVLVGDKKLILEQTKDLGLPAPTELDPHGQPVK